jgi:hypothetical protein
VRARAFGIALLLAASGCSSSTAESTVTPRPVIEPHVIDYLVSLNSATAYNTLEVQYADAKGVQTRDQSPSIVWTKHVRTKKGVSYVSLVGSAMNNGQQPPSGLPVETPNVQCTIKVDGVEARTNVGPYAANCDVNLSTWKSSAAPADG